MEPDSATPGDAGTELPVWVSIATPTDSHRGHIIGGRVPRMKTAPEPTAQPWVLVNPDGESRRETTDLSFASSAGDSSEAPSGPADTSGAPDRRPPSQAPVVILIEDREIREQLRVPGAAGRRESEVVNEAPMTAEERQLGGGASTPTKSGPAGGRSSPTCWAASYVGQNASARAAHAS